MSEKVECIFDGLIEVQTTLDQNDTGSASTKPAKVSEDAFRASEHLPSIPRHAQTQRALNDQLRDLSSVANRLGMNDAADFLRDMVLKTDARIG